MPGIGVHHTETVERDWDGPANVARLQDDQDYDFYADMFAWYAGDEPSNTSSYKFPHHEVGGAGSPGSANVRACVAAIAALNGARGGADIPEGDREAVYRHVAAHLRDADEDVPDLRGGTPTLALPQGEPRHVVVPPYGPETERRTVRMREVRVVDGEDGPRIEGYGAVFGEESEDLGGFVEVIEPGTFRKTIRESDVRSLFNHDANYVLGRSRSGSLSLREDKLGLFFSVVPPETSWARDLMVSIRRGDVDQCSFGFETVRDRWQREEGPDGDKRVVRTLLEVKLYDVGPVTFPAYPQTSAQVRSQVKRLRSEPPPGAGHGEDGAEAAMPRARVDVLRRRLELAEIE
jgi:hypothetical protein